MSELVTFLASGNSHNMDVPVFEVLGVTLRVVLITCSSVGEDDEYVLDIRTVIPSDGEHLEERNNKELVSSMLLDDPFKQGGMIMRIEVMLSWRRKREERNEEAKGSR